MARDTTVARRYALALFMAAQRKNAVDHVGQDLEAVVRLEGHSNERLRLFLEAPQTPTEQKLEVIEHLRSHAHGLVVEFLKLLLRKKRYFHLRDIATEFEHLVEAHKGIVRARVTSAVPLAEAEMLRLVDAFERQLEKKVRVVSHVDPEILGGLVVRVGDRIADKSVRTLLGQLKDDLLAARIPSS